MREHSHVYCPLLLLALTGLMSELIVSMLFVM